MIVKMYLKEMVTKVNAKFGEESKTAVQFRVMVKGYLKGLMKLEDLNYIYKKLLDKRIKP